MTEHEIIKQEIVEKEIAIPNGIVLERLINLENYENQKFGISFYTDNNFSLEKNMISATKQIDSIITLFRESHNFSYLNVNSIKKAQEKLETFRLNLQEHDMRKVKEIYAEKGLSGINSTILGFQHFVKNQVNFHLRELFSFQKEILNDLHLSDEGLKNLQAQYCQKEFEFVELKTGELTEQQATILELATKGFKLSAEKDENKPKDQILTLQQIFFEIMREIEEQ